MSDSSYAALAIYSQVVASIAFIVVVVVVWVRFIAPAVLASQATKNSELLDSERRRDVAKAEAEVAQAGIAAAEADVAAIKARAEADAVRMHDKIVTDSVSEGQRLIQNAEGELERARTVARDMLRTELLEKAMVIARESALKLNEATNSRLVGDAIGLAERTGSNG